MLMLYLLILHLLLTLLYQVFHYKIQNLCAKLSTLDNLNLNFVSDEPRFEDGISLFNLCIIMTLSDPIIIAESHPTHDCSCVYA